MLIENSNQAHGIGPPRGQPFDPTGWCGTNLCNGLQGDLRCSMQRGMHRFMTQHASTRSGQQFPLGYANVPQPPSQQKEHTNTKMGFSQRLCCVVFTTSKLKHRSVQHQRAHLTVCFVLNQSKSSSLPVSLHCFFSSILDRISVLFPLNKHKLLVNNRSFSHFFRSTEIFCWWRWSGGGNDLLSRLRFTCQSFCT